MSCLLFRRSVQSFMLISVFVFCAHPVCANVYFPQIAAGGGYITVVTLMHVDARTTAPITGHLKFYNPDGSARTVTTTELGQSNDFTIIIPSQGTRVLTVTSTASLTSVGTAVFEAPNVSVGGVARFSLGNDSVGVIDAKPVGIAYIPLTTKAGFGNGVAIQNPGATPVNIRLRLIRPDGAIDQTSTPAEINPLPPFGQFSRFVGPEMGFNNPAQTNSTLEIAVQGAGSIAILPLVLGNGFTSSASLITSDLDAPLFFAQVVDGGGFTTAFRLYNPSQYRAIGFIRFLGQTGNPRALPIAGLGNVSSISLSIGSGQTVEYETTGASTGVSVGMARLDTSVPVGGLATLFYGQTHIGVPAASPMRSARIPVDTTGGNTGVALATSGANNVNLKLTLQDRDGLTPQVSTPPELTPLRVNQQYARYVTEMGFANSSNLRDSSLLVETVGIGDFIPLALLDRGSFSSTATSRQRLSDPQALAGMYSGGWSVPTFLTSGTMTLTLTVDASNNASISMNVFDTQVPTTTGTFNADGELIINGLILGDNATITGQQLMNVRVRADGVVTLFFVNLGTGLNTPLGRIAWTSVSGEFVSPRVTGAILLGLEDGTLINGTFNMSK
jgi:hypothetical protein